MVERGGGITIGGGGVDVASLLNRALSCLQQGLGQEAADLLNQALEADPRNPEAQHLTGILYQQQGMHAEARAFLERAVEWAPGNPSYQLNLGVTLADLGEVLQLKAPPRRIEGFDISNIYGRQAVGSMVTFVQGKPEKQGYKRFKIKTVKGIDDYAMMQEVVRRRYGKLVQKPGAGEWENERMGRGRKYFTHSPTPPFSSSDLPDLIVIDGGKGHLNAALKVLRGLKLSLPIIGIAKEFEQLFLPGQSEPIALPPQSKALQLLQRVRDEAHRFAIGYHRLLRGKDALTSALDRIPGIGPRKKQDLIVRFGSVEVLRKAKVEELEQVRGISPLLAERIYRGLKKK